MASFAPLLHDDESGVASWMHPLLVRLGVADATAAAAISAAALTTTGALRELRSQAVVWKAFLEQLADALSASLGGSDYSEDVRQSLLERLDEALEAVQVKRPRTEEPAAPLQPPTAEAEEILRTRQWCSKQPIIVRRFVARVHPIAPGEETPQVQCTCGHECRSNNFRAHVVSGVHAHEFFAQLDQAEAVGAQAAVLRVAELLGALEQRASETDLTASALRSEVSTLQAQLVALEGQLDGEKRAHCLYETRYTSAQAKLDAQAAAMRSFTSPTARLHQQLWQQGLFDKKQHPLNNTLDELHYLSLVRVAKGDDVKRGGRVLHLTSNAHALATLLHAKTNSSGYRLLRGVYRWLPSPEDVRRLPALDKGGPFVAVGCHQLEWGQQAFRFYAAAGYDPRTEPFGVCFDPAKLMAEVTWDAKTNGEACRPPPLPATPPQLSLLGAALPRRQALSATSTSTPSSTSTRGAT